MLKKILAISITLFFASLIGFETYNSNQVVNILEFEIHNKEYGNFIIKGEEVKIIEDIFLNKTKYVEESLFKEFPQSEDEYSFLSYPKNSNPEYEDFTLNFGVQDNPKEKEYVVFGNILGGQDRHGYIRGDAYYQLSSIIKKYQDKQKNN